MLNPLQAASSFACDGCGHHASFHNLRNPGEDDFEGAEVREEGGSGGALLTPRKLLNGTGATRKRSATASASGGGGGRVENGRPLGGEDGDSGDDVQIVKRVRN